jgi:hypothetical protein
MMKFARVLMGVGFTMSVAATAQAGNLTADCSGWSDYGLWDVGHPANFSATATLERYDAATGTWSPVDTSNDAASLAPYSEFTLGGTWSGELDGTYRASLIVYAEVIFSETSKEIWGPYLGEYGPFDCTKPPPPDDKHNPARTPGYWKNHPESWPVTSLTLGGASYSQACLLNVLDLSTRSDVRIPLIHHLIAAKLNVLPNSIPGIGGTDPAIQPTIDAGDAFLIQTGTTINCTTLRLNGTKPTGALADQSNAIKDALDDYNNNYYIEANQAPLTAEEGGCTAMSKESGLEALALPLLALFFVRSRRRRN